MFKLSGQQMLVVLMEQRQRPLRIAGTKDVFLLICRAVNWGTLMPEEFPVLRLRMSLSA